MKLPDDKQQRMKVLLMIGLGAVFVVLGLVQGVINPLRKYHKGRLAALEESQTLIDMARKEIRAATRAHDADYQTLKDIESISDRYLLHPILGNYSLGSSAMIEEHAKEAGVTVSSVQELGISELPGKLKLKEGHAVKAYTVRVALSCGYNDITRFLWILERSNPYVSVIGIRIAGRRETPEAHDITLDIQWPIWADTEAPAKIKQAIRDAQTRKRDIET